MQTRKEKYEIRNTLLNDNWQNRQHNALRYQTTGYVSVQLGFFQKSQMHINNNALHAHGMFNNHIITLFTFG